MGPAERRISRRVFLSSHPEYHQNVAGDLIGPDKSAAMCFLSLDNDKPHMSKISQDVHFAVNKYYHLTSFPITFPVPLFDLTFFPLEFTPSQSGCLLV